MTSHRLWLALWLLSSLTFGAAADAFATPAPVVSVASSGPVQLARAQPAQAPSTPAAPAASTPAPDATAQARAATAEPIGNVVKPTGIATVIRNKNSLPLHLRDDIYLNETVQTSSSSSAGGTS